MFKVARETVLADAGGGAAVLLKQSELGPFGGGFRRSVPEIEHRHRLAVVDRPCLEIALAIAIGVVREQGAEAALSIALAYVVQVQAAWYVRFTDRLFGHPGGAQAG